MKKLKSPGESEMSSNFTFAHKLGSPVSSIIIPRNLLTDRSEETTGRDVQDGNGTIRATK